jgi:hypothetical protein
MLSLIWRMSQFDSFSIQLGMSRLNIAAGPKNSGVWDYFMYGVDKNCAECVIAVSNKT